LPVHGSDARFLKSWKLPMAKAGLGKEAE